EKRTVKKPEQTEKPKTKQDKSNDEKVSSKMKKFFGYFFE
ncbi:hypothetical protein, partial [Bacillus sp. SG-1]